MSRAISPNRQRTPLGRWLVSHALRIEDLAKIIEVTPAALHHYMAGRNQPSAKKLIRLSEITGIAPGVLLASFPDATG